MTIKDFFKKVFIPGSDAPACGTTGASTKVSPLTRQELSDLLLRYFAEELKRMSTQQGLLFPTVFTVLMHRDEYDAHADSLGFTVKELVGRFVDGINKIINRYPDYILHSNHWVFQFIPVDDDVQLAEGMENARPELRDPLVLMQLYSRQAITDNHLREGRVVGTLQTKNSLQVVPSGFNIRALGPVDRLAEGKFIVKVSGIKSSAQPVTTTGEPAQHPPKPKQGNKGVEQRLKADTGAFIDRFDAPTTTIDINPGATRIEIHGRDTSVTATADMQIVKVDSQEVVNPHIVFERDADGFFYFTPLAKVTVNEEPIARDTSMRRKLPRNSTITIGTAIQFKFIY